MEEGGREVAGWRAAGWRNGWRNGWSENAVRFARFVVACRFAQFAVFAVVDGSWRFGSGLRFGSRPSSFSDGVPDSKEGEEQERHGARKVERVTNAVLVCLLAHEANVVLPRRGGQVPSDVLAQPQALFTVELRSVSSRFRDVLRLIIYPASDHG